MQWIKERKAWEQFEAERIAEKEKEEKANAAQEQSDTEQTEDSTTE